MAEFTVDAQRLEPYQGSKFKLKWLNAQGVMTYVAGISKVSALKRTTAVVTFRDGGLPSTNLEVPGHTTFEPITLERGVTHDLEFEAWAAKVWQVGAGLGAEVSLKDFRKDVILDFFNEAGQLAISYNIYGAWPSEYQALPDLDANANAIAIQHLKLQHQGWKRDTSVTEPTPPSYTSTLA
jgi:phage tail-like protein